MMPAHEYLEELWRNAKKSLPGWQYAMLRRMAQPVAGGRASHRIDEPTLLEKVALEEISPSRLKGIDDDDLNMVWLRLNQWFMNAKRRRQAVENFVNAAMWTKREIERRGRQVDDSPLTDAIAQLAEVEKERKATVRGKKGQIPSHLERVLQTCDDITIVRDFVTIAGSAAVSENPGDIDVVVRAPYDSAQGSYGLDGASLWVALRRFLAPDKEGPQIQLVGSPTGSFTDYVPVFDLVARRREPEVIKIEDRPPDYKKQRRVIKVDQNEARAATPEIRAEGVRSRTENRVEPGRFFFQPKPTRAVAEEQPQSVEAFLKFYTDRADEWLPAIVQKKYDGARHQIHKKGERVLVYSEDGDDNTDRLPGLVETIRKLPVENAVFDTELEMWQDGNHFPREAMSGYLAMQSEPDDSRVVANLFDVLFWDNQDLHSNPLVDRLAFLDKVKGQSTMEAPNLDQRVNIAPRVVVKTPSELRSEVDRIRKLPGSEGIVAKQIGSAYPLDTVSNDSWVKFHNATTFRAKVLAKNRLRGGAFNYDYGILPGKGKTLFREGDLVPVGRTFSTSRSFAPGDLIEIEAEQVNLELHPAGIVLSTWVPRVLGGNYQGTPDTVDDVVQAASKNLVLRTKRMDENGKVVSYLAPNVLKRSPTVVSMVGDTGTPIAFVGASPGRIDLARRELLVGPVGETFKNIYLKPLNLTKSEVGILNIVPVLLEDAKGQSREPNPDEIQTWTADFFKRLDALRPLTVVALGRTAQAVLKDRADLALPHPSAVRRFGDSGEVGRKLKRLSQVLNERLIQKQTIETEDTRNEVAVRNWNERWQELMPAQGEGQFVYQHHWRGIPEDELNLDDSQLMETDHSIHGDLRLQADDKLWGFTIFLGETKDNRGPNLDKLIDWKDGDNIEISPKLQQPLPWLQIGIDKPYVSPPGAVGATSKMFSKFFARDKGKYRMGVARLHSVEIFLDGEHLNGRYILTFAPVAGKRRWLIEKPVDQTPLAERTDIADVLGELKRKGQRFLYWSSPSTASRLVDVKTGRDVELESGTAAKIVKSDPVKRIVYGVVLDPYGNLGTPTFDAHGDWPSPKTVENSAHNFMRGNRTIKLQHKDKANATLLESWVEPYPSRRDYLSAIKGADHSIYRRPFGSDFLHSGSWAIAVELGPDEWTDYEEGKFNAFSPGGMGLREPRENWQLPKVDVKELKP